jgi:hypothetical protein
MRNGAGTLLAEGFVRVASVDLATFTPRDLPAEVVKMVELLPELAAQQQRNQAFPWV